MNVSQAVYLLGLTKHWINSETTLHPALSIILFSTLSGAGFGLGAVIGITGLPDGSSVVSSFPLLAPVCVAASMASLGLFCSVLHLRRPERAWRAFSQWRSSWLSREGILAILTLLSLVIFAFMQPVDSIITISMGVIVSVLCLLTIFATSMIYTQLRAVPAWNTSLTPILYLAFALAGGVLTALVLTAGFRGLSINGDVYLSEASIFIFDGLVAISTTAILLAWILQIAWWKRLDRTGTGQSTAESATQLKEFGKVRLLEPPHTCSNYLLDEMGFVIGRKHASKLRFLSLFFGGLLPILALLLTQIFSIGLFANFALALTALVTHLAGVLLSRWLFFAEARHTVTLYY